MANQALLALAAGLGGGYMAGTERRKDRERQAKIDAQNQELHDARMEEINAARQQRIALADAAAPRTADAGTVVGGAGFYKDPAQAQAGQDMVQNISAMGADPSQQDQLQAETQMRGEAQGGAPVSLGQAKPGYGVTAGSKAAITADKPNLDAENTQDAKLKRQIAVIQTTDPIKAITLANAAMENKQRLQKEADDAAFRRINGFQTPQEMADFMTNYPHDGMAGKFKAKVVPSADGKTWSFVGTDKDGNEVKIPGDYTNDENGMMDARMALAGRFGDPNRRLEFYKWDQETGRKKTLASETARHNSVMEGAATTQAQAAMKRASAVEKATSGNGAAGGRVQKTFVDGDGYMVGVLRDGTSKRLVDGDGNPIRADSAEKRVDQLTKYLMDNSREHRRMPYADVRKAAEGILRSSPPAAASTAQIGGTEGPQAMPTSKTELKKGAVYNTARGPARWNGTAFEAQ